MAIRRIIRTIFLRALFANNGSFVIAVVTLITKVSRRRLGWPHLAATDGSVGQTVFRTSVYFAGTLRS